MKKRIAVCVLALILLSLPLWTCAYAEPTGENAAIRHIVDMYGLLTEEQAAELEVRAAELSEQNKCAIYIIVIENYTQYAPNMKSMASAIYDEFKLGYDNGNGQDKRDYLLLLLSIAERDYTIDTCGYLGNQIFNNSGITDLEEVLIPKLKNNDWYGAFSAFLDKAEDLFLHPVQDNVNELSPYASEQYGYEKPNSQRRINPLGLILSIVIPCVIATGVCEAYRKQMKNAKAKYEAGNYVSGATYTVRQDTFINRTVTRQVIQNDNVRSGGGGGGGGGHFSGGHSGHSGKF